MELYIHLENYSRSHISDDVETQLVRGKVLAIGTFGSGGHGGANFYQIWQRPTVCQSSEPTD